MEEDEDAYLGSVCLHGVISKAVSGEKHMKKKNF